jgi:hypothetical protein
MATGRTSKSPCARSPQAGPALTWNRVAQFKTLAVGLKNAHRQQHGQGHPQQPDGYHDHRRPAAHGSLAVRHLTRLLLALLHDLPAVSVSDQPHLDLRLVLYRGREADLRGVISSYS